MVFTQQSLEYEWLYSLKLLVHFRSKNWWISLLTIHRFNVSLAPQLNMYSYNEKNMRLRSTLDWAIFVLKLRHIVIWLSIYRKLYLVQGATFCVLEDECWPWLFANTVDFDDVIMSQHHTENKWFWHLVCSNFHYHYPNHKYKK